MVYQCVILSRFGNGEEKGREYLSEHYSGLCSVFTLF